MTGGSMRWVALGLVVEGHGEVQALPVLLRRIARKVAPEAHVILAKPVRVPKGKLLRDEKELLRAARLAERKAAAAASDRTFQDIPATVGILVLVDADQDCPAEVGPVWRKRLEERFPDHPVAVVLAKREFESWFVAGASSLFSELQELDLPADPEALPGANAWDATWRRATGRRSIRLGLRPNLTWRRPGSVRLLSRSSGGIWSVSFGVDAELRRPRMGRPVTARGAGGPPRGGGPCP